ncbi:cobalt ECF transporter T component CbiQ [Deltaproteobacteria bacterium TL4]
MSGQYDINSIIDSERRFEATNGRGGYQWDPRFKLGLLIAVIILNIGLAISWLSGCLLLIGLLLILWSRTPLARTLAFFLAPLVATLVVVAGYSVGFGVTPLFQFWKVTLYHEGLVQGIGVVLRVYCDMTWLALVFMTTPFAEVLVALRWYKMPEILVDTLAMMYRYSFLLYSEFTRMNTAAFSRGGRSGKMTTLKTVSRIGAQIFMRAYDRSETIYLARLARGGEKL